MINTENLYQRIITQEADRILIACELLSDNPAEVRVMIDDIWDKALTKLYKKVSDKNSKAA
jgi:hypothetical protein